MKPIKPFDFEEGEIINGKYEILSMLGKGFEGEVYLVKELSSGIERAAKFFYPAMNPKDSVSKRYAKKLHALRNCDIIIHYHGQETYFHDGEEVTMLISEYIEGQLLSDWIKDQPGKRLHPFAALHLLHALAKGMEQVHLAREHHGDLHDDNLIVQRVGLNFELKLLDLYHRGRAKRQNIEDDVVEMIQIFYEVLGGRNHYASLPPEFKEIICGRKRSLILRKFNTAGKLKMYLEHMQWV